MRNDTAPRVLVVEDDDDMAILLREILASEGFEAVVADERLSLETLLRQHPRLVLLDYVLRGAWGDELVRTLRSRLAHVPIVLLSGVNDIEQRAREIGASAFLAKPFEIDALVRTCRRFAAA